MSARQKFIFQLSIIKLIATFEKISTMRKPILIIAILIFCRTANAQSAADSAINHSRLKTLSDKQYDALVKGEDIYGMSLAAELNHYPNPEKVMKYKKQLDLSPIQVNQFNAINKELHRKKLEMGQIIIHNERTLDSIFKYHRLDNGSLIFFANRYGLYQGEMRNVILQSCLKAWELLTPQQIKKYEALERLTPATLQSRTP
ncbi:MAG: hypothetical protein JWP94_3742 [Mucilaginibacter sp.]|nr:hypothetical protein [Mucilaginibacter sp.]